MDEVEAAGRETNRAQLVYHGVVMRLMRRMAYSVVLLLCSSIFSASMFLWMCTPWYSDSFDKRDRHTQTCITFAASSIYYERRDGMRVSNEDFNRLYDMDPKVPWRIHSWTYSRELSDWPMSWGTLEYSYENEYSMTPKVGPPVTLLRIRVPYWIPTFASGAAGTFLLVERYRRWLEPNAAPKTGCALSAATIG